MEDFNLPGPERITLLSSLQETIGDVPPYFWAICQVCELEALEKLIEVARISPAMVRISATQTYAMVLYWTQSTRGSSRNATPTTPGLGSSGSGSPEAKRQKITHSPSSPSLLHRNKAATALAKERDSHCCVLTNDSAIDVAHIYPFCGLKGSEENVFGERHLFWEHLKNFWSEEKVAAWEAELFPRGLSETGDDRVDNRITLSKNAHLQWNRGAFALKPISICENNTTLKVQFFWQKKQNDIKVTMSLLTAPLSTEDLDHNEGAFEYGNTALYFPGPKAIKSGQIFELKTTDPIKKPLPSFKLLELQWALTRVIGMAGAAFPYEATSGDDLDEDIPGLDLDEVGDTSFVSDLLDSPEHLREASQRLVESVKHDSEGMERDGEQLRSSYN